ncbi:MAG: hypothetical protein L3I91_01685 [Mycoplasma sp.]
MNTDILQTVVTVLGYIGAVCIALYTLPGAIRILKTKDASGVDLPLFSILTFGALLFFISGLISAIALGHTDGLTIGVCAANGICTVGSGITLFFKLKDIFGKDKGKKAKK